MSILEVRDVEQEITMRTTILLARVIDQEVTKTKASFSTLDQDI